MILTTPLTHYAHSFDVHQMNIKLGPWRFSIPLKKDGKKPEDLPDA